MMRAKLTADDLLWLERSLSAAMVPVTPRAEFVDDARQALLRAAPDHQAGQSAAWLPMVSAILTVCGLVLLLAALRRRRKHLCQAASEV